MKLSPQYQNQIAPLKTIHTDRVLRGRRPCVKETKNCRFDKTEIVIVGIVDLRYILIVLSYISNW